MDLLSQHLDLLLLLLQSGDMDLLGQQLDPPALDKILYSVLEYWI